MAITQEVNIDMLEKLPDGNFKRKNPKTTKAQAGLGNVENYGIATKAEVEAGTNNAKYVTPLRVKEALAFMSVSDKVISQYTVNTSSSTISITGLSGYSKITIYISNLIPSSTGTLYGYINTTSASSGFNVITVTDSTVPKVEDEGRVVLDGSTNGQSWHKIELVKSSGKIDVWASSKTERKSTVCNANINLSTLSSLNLVTNRTINAGTRILVMGAK